VYGWSLLQAGTMTLTAMRGTGVFLPGFSGRTTPVCSTTLPKASQSSAAPMQPRTADADINVSDDLAENPPSREGSCASLHSYDRRDSGFQGDGVVDSSSSCSSRPGSCNQEVLPGTHSQQLRKLPLQVISTSRDQAKPSRRGIFSEAQLLQEFAVHQAADATLHTAASAPAAPTVAQGSVPHPSTPAGAVAGASMYHIPMQPPPSILKYFSTDFLELWSQSNNGCNCSACVQCRSQLQVSMEAAAAAAAAAQSLAGTHHHAPGYGMQPPHGAMAHPHPIEQGNTPS
jgi:hypothetical protein